MSVVKASAVGSRKSSAWYISQYDVKRSFGEFRVKCAASYELGGQMCTARAGSAWCVHRISMQAHGDCMVRETWWQGGRDGRLWALCRLDGRSASMFRSKCKLTQYEFFEFEDGTTRVGLPVCRWTTRVGLMYHESGFWYHACGFDSGRLVRDGPCAYPRHPLHWRSKHDLR